MSHNNDSKIIKILFTLCSILLVSVCSTTKNESDSKNDITTRHITKLAFGSCNSQIKPQEIWNAITEYNPDVWIWTGDVVYAENRKLHELQAAYDIQKSNKEYTNFIQASPHRIIEGTWDDHDYGENDAGRKLQNKIERQQMFLDFLQIPKTETERWNRNGVYWSFNVPLKESDGQPTTEHVKVILLDTRSFRDPYVIPSVANWPMPLSAFIAASIRYLSVFLGLNLNHKGDILGEAQWKWFEDELANSDASFHVIVSSIQVFTTNSLVESWEHFPESKKRLWELLKMHESNGILLLSGDVHHAEFIADSNGELIEVTSSGLTHVCNGHFFVGFACEIVIKHFYTHRKNLEDYYIGKNFGALEFSRSIDNSHEMEITVKIMNQFGEVVLQTQRPLAPQFVINEITPSNSIFMLRRIGAIVCLIILAIVGYKIRNKLCNKAINNLNHGKKKN